MPKNPQNDHVSVLAASRKKRAAPEHLLQTHSTFSMLLMVSMVMSKLGKMNLICVDPWGDQWCILPGKS